ncbi:hypothetical protein SAMN05660653_03171 [Desulfonatronum thiosulfatophilum]|uniref:Uncharacterized protein n=1 Tax=Desulfonatronum thiosulfatophilum TaxID=617002 RepID=A0A1G6EUG2_9BACT|nr:hypothetical protein SAMN05660653_03171 [Desulfonatronum thiosulfatophilum]
MLFSDRILDIHVNTMEFLQCCPFNRKTCWVNLTAPAFANIYAILTVRRKIQIQPRMSRWSKKNMVN